MSKTAEQTYFQTVRNRLFEAHAHITAGTISNVGSVFEWLADKTLSFGIFLQETVATFGMWTMNMLYKDKVEEAEQQIEAVAVKVELMLLSKISELKDHAVEIGEWTDHHTVALNAIAQALIDQCNYSKDDAHMFCKRVVESVPGLTYGEE